MNKKNINPAPENTRAQNIESQGVNTNNNEVQQNLNTEQTEIYGTGNANENYQTVQNTQNYPTSTTQTVQDEINIQNGNNNQDLPIYQGSSGGQSIGSINADSSDNAIVVTKSEDFSNKKVSKDLLIVVFLSAIGLYLIVSIIIYFSSYIIKSKNDDIVEEFIVETQKDKKKEENQFFMDPAIHKTPAIKQALDLNEEFKLNLKDDYDNIWEKNAAPKNEIKIHVDKNNYPITTPIIASPMINSPLTKNSPSPMISSPLQKNASPLISNDTGFSPPAVNYGIQKHEIEESQRMEYGHHTTNSTSSSVASETQLLSEEQKKINEDFNNEIDEFRPRTTSENRKHEKPRNYHRPPRSENEDKLRNNNSGSSNVHQFNNGPSSPHIKFSVERVDSGSRKQFAPPSGSSSNNNIRNPNMRSPNMRSPNMRSPNMRSPNMRSPNMRSPNMRERSNPDLSNPHSRPIQPPTSRTPRLREGNSNEYVSGSRTPNLRTQGTPKMH